MKRSLVQFLALVVFAIPALANGGSLDVTVFYEGPGQVDENHGLILFVFSDDDFSNPANPIVGTRYLATNGATASFTNLDVKEVWVMAVYDEIGGYAIGPLPGPLGLYSDTAGMPSGVEVGGEGIELRFDDSLRMPPPPEAKPTATFESLQKAEGGIVEIRVYRAKPGKRDEFVRFFESTLADQAKAGIRVPGQFESLDDENTFVWMRAFRSQKERQEQSRAFYFGPTWLAERRAAAMDLIESTEVMLIEPTGRSEIR